MERQVSPGVGEAMIAYIRRKYTTLAFPESLEPSKPDKPKSSLVRLPNKRTCVDCSKEYQPKVNDYSGVRCPKCKAQRKEVSLHTVTLVCQYCKKEFVHMYKGGSGANRRYCQPKCQSLAGYYREKEQRCGNPPV